MPRDGEQVEAFLRGHRQSGAVLVDRYYGRILAFFRNKAPAAANDLTQQVFVECFAALGRLRDPARFRSFLFAVACNQLRKHYARARRDGDHLDFGTVSAIDLDPSPSRIVAGKQEQQLVLEGLRRLPVDYQIVLELVFWEDMTAAEISEVLDVPLGTVKTRIRRGKALLGEAVAALTAIADPLAAADVDGWARGLRERLRRQRRAPPPATSSVRLSEGLAGTWRWWRAEDRGHRSVYWLTVRKTAPPRPVEHVPAWGRLPPCRRPRTRRLLPVCSFALMALVTGVPLKALSTWLLSLSLGSQAPAEAQANRCDASFEEYSKAGNERFKAAELAFAEGDWVRAEHLSVEVAYNFQCAAQRSPDDPLDPLRYAYNALANLKERLPGGPTKETQCALKKVCEQLLPLLPNDDASATYKHRCETVDDPCPEPVPPPPPPPRAQRLLAAGSTLLGLGIGALAAMSAGLIVSDRAQEDLKSVPENERLPVFARGHLGNALAWGAGTSGAVLVISGVTLLAVGLRLRSRGRVRVEPRPAPGAFSLHLSARF